MKYFLESEYLEGEDQKIYCSRCKDLRNFYKKYNFDRLPPILIISLKRFKFAKMYKVKLDNLIDFPIYDLDISDLSDSKLPLDFKQKYDLYGIIVTSKLIIFFQHSFIIKFIYFYENSIKKL